MCNKPFGPLGRKNMMCHDKGYSLCGAIFLVCQQQKVMNLIFPFNILLIGFMSGSQSGGVDQIHFASSYLHTEGVKAETF